MTARVLRVGGEIAPRREEPNMRTFLSKLQERIKPPLRRARKAIKADLDIVDIIIKQMIKDMKDAGIEI